MMNEPRVLCLVNMYTWSDGKQIAVPGSFSVFEGCCVQEDASIVGKPDLDVAPRQCVGSRVAPHPQLLAKHQTSVVLHPPYSPDLPRADFVFQT